MVVVTNENINPTGNTNQCDRGLQNITNQLNDVSLNKDATSSSRRPHAKRSSEIGSWLVGKRSNASSRSTSELGFADDFDKASKYAHAHAPSGACTMLCQCWSYACDIRASHMHHDGDHFTDAAL